MRTLWLAVVLGAALGCTDDGAGDTCPLDLPPACASPAPSWQALAPVFGERCGACHGPGGVEAARPLEAYADVYARRVSVLSQVYGCVMPPPDAGSLTPAERAAVLGWLVCGAPAP